ncbi:hypothetical protein [Rhodococcus sp. ACS1]|nr:hypothetical protein [Rhodococcus sp. ACS1]
MTVGSGSVGLHVVGSNGHALCLLCAVLEQRGREHKRPEDKGGSDYGT